MIDAKTLEQWGNLGASAVLGLALVVILFWTIPKMVRAHADAIKELVGAFREERKGEQVAREKDRTEMVAALDRNTSSNNTLSARMENFCKARAT